MNQLLDYLYKIATHNTPNYVNGWIPGLHTLLLWY